MRRPLPLTRPKALAPFAAIALVCLLLAARIVTYAIGDGFASSDPDFALMFDGGHARAHVAQAQEQLRVELPGESEAAERARAALRIDPLAAGAARILALVQAREGDVEGAEALMRIAARQSRDVLAQVWLFERDASAGRLEPALGRLDVMFRTQGVWGNIVPSLAPYLTMGPAVAPFARLLADNPPWRSSFLIAAANQAKDVGPLARLFNAMDRLGSPARIDELRPFLTRLVGEGRLEEAYLAWLQSLPNERLATMSRLYNADFRFDVTNAPFDWVLTPVAGAGVEIVSRGKERILDVTFLGGRVPFRHVAHLMVLQPGAYRFAGRERSSELVNERGLRWRIFCVEDPSGSLGVTPPLNGDTPWREFSVDFSVPEGCRAQTLLLELPARVVLEQEISGGASYAHLAIEPR